MLIFVLPLLILRFPFFRLPTNLPDIFLKLTNSSVLLKLRSEKIKDIWDLEGLLSWYIFKLLILPLFTFFNNFFIRYSWGRFGEKWNTN